MPASKPYSVSPDPAPASPAGQAPLNIAELLTSAGPAVRALLRSKYQSALRAEDVEDVLAAALHQVWTHRAKFDPVRGSLRAWFLRIADHAAQDLLKKGWLKARQLEVATDEFFWDRQAAPGETTTPVAPPAKRQLVKELLEALPEVQRRILWTDALCSDGGPCSSELLSRELGISVGAVRVYRKRGLDRLRHQLLNHPLSKISNQ